jgi:hypothetical protein
MENVVGGVRNAGVIKGVIVCDATFIKAYSKRDPKDDSRGCARACAELAGRVPLTYYSLSVLNRMLMRSLSMLG